MKILVLIAICIGAVLCDNSPQIIEARNDGESRIVGGAPVPLGQIPYFAFVLGTSAGISVECGGALIAYNWVLTAAHCMFLQTFEVNVFLGLVHRTAPPLFESGPLFSDSFVTHPQFNVNTLLNDIALVNIPTTAAILLNPNIGLVQLPQTNDGNVNLVGRSATVSGFGDDITGNPSNFLNAVDVNIVANTVCQAALAPSPITASHVCTANTGAQGACFGDGGGPLVTLIATGRRAIVGIVTVFSLDGCREGIPGSYTRVTSYLNWINSWIGGGGVGTTTVSTTTANTTTTVRPPGGPTTTPRLTTTRRSSASKSSVMSLMMIVGFVVACMKMN